MTVILIVLLVLVFAGGGWGYRTGYVGAQSPVGIILLVLVLLLVLGLLGGPRAGLW
jgi:hypothetical protein